MLFSDVQLIGKLGEMEKEIIQLRQQASDNEAAIDDYKQMLLALQKENAMLRHHIHDLRSHYDLPSA